MNTSRLHFGTITLSSWGTITVRCIHDARFIKSTSHTLQNRSLVWKETLSFINIYFLKNLIKNQGLMLGTYFNYDQWVSDFRQTKAEDTHLTGWWWWWERITTTPWTAIDIGSFYRLFISTWASASGACRSLVYTIACLTSICIIIIIERTTTNAPRQWTSP